MKSVSSGWINKLLGAALFVASYAAGAAGPANYITLATGEWAPYVSADQLAESSGQYSGRGIALEIVAATLADMHYRPHFEFLAWQDTQAAVEQNMVRAAFPFYDTPERRQRLLYSDKLTSSTTAVFYNLDRVRNPEAYKHYADLDRCVKPCVVGRVQGYAYPEGFERHAANADYSANELEAFEKLIRGDIYMLAADEKVARALLEQHFPTAQHQVAPLPAMEKQDRGLYLVAGKTAENAAFITAFNQALQQLRARGEVARILEHYARKVRTVFEVRLRATGSYPLIFGSSKDAPDTRNTVLIPRGTRAVVVSWHKSFSQPGELDVQRQMREKSLVKVMEGPMHGRLLWVPNIFISFE